MSTNFPTTLDALTNPTSTDKVSVVDHAAQHANANDAIEALEAKVGVNSSAVTTSHDYKLSNVTGTDKAVSLTGSEVLTNKTISGASNTLTVRLDNTDVTGTLPVSKGGLGVVLADPNADRIMFWDDSAGNHAYLTAGTGLSITGTTLTASSQNFTVTMTADEDLTIGQTVGTSMMKNDYVARARRNRTSATIDHTATAYSTGKSDLQCPIGGDKFVFLTTAAAGSDTLYATVGSINTSTKTVTVGTSVAVATTYTPGNMSDTSICKLDTDKFIVFYQKDASTTIIYYRVGTVSGTVITFGTEGTFATAATGVDKICSATLGTDKGIVFYQTLTTTDSRVIAFTVSSTTATMGTPASVGTTIDAGKAHRLIKIGTDKFVLTAILLNAQQAQVGTVSGTTITMGADTQIGTEAADGNGVYDQNALTSPATDVFVYRFAKSASTTGLIACTVSSTTPTSGTPVVVSVDADDKGGIYSESSSSILVHGDGGFERFTLSGTTLTSTSVSVFSNTSYWLIPMDNSYWITGIFSTATTLSITVQGMAEQFLGIAQSTVSKGQTVDILYAGKDSNQSGLVAGNIYTVSATGGLTQALSTTTNQQLGLYPIIRAVNATSVVF